MIITLVVCPVIGGLLRNPEEQLTGLYGAKFRGQKFCILKIKM